MQRTYTETCRNTAHHDGDKVVKVAICQSGELEGTEADVVQCLVVNAEGLIRVLNELMHGESGVVRL